jgi:hypothetical protein
MHIGLVLRNLPISKANHCREELWVEETGNKGWTQEGKNLVENTGSSTYRDVDVPNHDMLPSNTQRALTRWKMSGSKGARRRGGAFRGGTSGEALRRGMSDRGITAGVPGGRGGRPGGGNIRVVPSPNLPLHPLDVNRLSSRPQHLQSKFHSYTMDSNVLLFS